MLGYEVEKSCKMLIKTSSTVEYIKSDIQNIETPRRNDLIIWYVWENMFIGFPWGSF